MCYCQNNRDCWSINDNNGIESTTDFSNHLNAKFFALLDSRFIVFKALISWHQTVPLSSSSSFVIELQSVSRYLSISSGFFLFATGILGNCLNVVTFLSIWVTIRHNPCSLYMLAKALVELNALIVGLGTRILAAGFQIDWALTNRPWCKIRRCWITMNNVISFSLLAVQSIDIFLCSSSSALTTSEEQH